MDLSTTIAPKSNQLNADDLIAGPRTIVITQVKAGNDEQPVAVRFEGDNGKPWYPCKSMRRVLVHAWGADGASYVGRAVTLFCDSTVEFGNIAVGGIRISHLSHIERQLSIALTVTRKRRAPYVVKPLELPQAAPEPTAEQLAGQAMERLLAAELTGDGLKALLAELGPVASLEELPIRVLNRLAGSGASEATIARWNAAAAPAAEPTPTPTQTNS